MHCTGHLILCNGAISHNWPRITSDRTIEENRIIREKMLNSSKVNDEFYRKIHYLTREFHVKLHAKTDRDSCDIGFQVQFNVEFTRIESHNWIKIRKKKKTAIIFYCCFYPERTLQKAISKSTVRTVITLAKRKQGQSYTSEPLTTFFVPCACFTFVFKLFLHVNKLHTNCKDK